MCSPADVLKSLSIVNRQWAETISSNEISKELWNTFLEDLYIPPHHFTHPKTTCASYIRQQQAVVDLQPNKVQILDKMKGVWTSAFLSKPMRKQEYSYAVLFDGSLLCCGGLNYVDFQSGYENLAYRITLDGEVSPLGPMITGRYWRGIAAYGRKVFVFGGVGKFLRYLRSIEQYDGSSWSELPTKLNADRWNLVPTIYKGGIYLCDDPSKPIEVFNSQTLTVEILATTTSFDHRCNAITFYEGRLVVIGAKEVWRWDEERKEFEVIQKTKYHIQSRK